MNAILSDLAQLAGQSDATFGAFDPSPLFAGSQFTLAPKVRQYFSEDIPSTKLDLNFYRIFAAADIRTENQDNIPSYQCAPHGFITIATDLGGDAYSVDVTDGRVYHISHDKYEGDAIEPGWNTDHTAFLSPLPINRQNIINTSEGYWESIENYLEECLAYATANG